MVQVVAGELKSRLTDEEIEYEVAALEKQRKQKKDEISTTASAPRPQDPVTAPRDPARDPAVTKDPLEGIGPDEPITPLHVNLASLISLKPGDSMMAEILERYPNGNYKIRASKVIQYRNTKRMIRVLGIVRSSDISDDDIVSSGKLYEYRVQVYR
jgi:hypothetical protein